MLTISRLLGHKSFATTMIYLHVRRTHLGSAPSPMPASFVAIIAIDSSRDCGDSLEMIYVEDKPSWSKTMHRPRRPRWYQESG
ncbi:Integrase, catalytic core, phage domain protein [Rhodopirellula maiorica SM1]|uniref:Integrase, catalytic core, phage domain protein n=1 Tax=Rhodopirellula maiorica SM1 TaxID=1265738 RepID=M5R8G3_9BACT|nr:Integrase, catalytic core, phage domain protein [Rhodopirellula maiorica SM1]